MFATLLLIAIAQATPVPPMVPVRPVVPAFDPLPGGRQWSAADEARLVTCRATAAEDADAGIMAANSWLQEGGGLLAKTCLGTAFALAGQFGPALSTFTEAAGEADAAGDPRGGQLWAQAGNAALASGDAATARRYLDTAIGSGRLAGPQLGVIHADRARALVGLGDPAAARADLDLATRLAPQDGTVWLLSATLARRMRDYARAQNDIQQAATLTPRDPAIALEAGNIAYMVDNLAAARLSWQSAIAIDPTSAAAAAARAQLRDADDELTSPPRVDARQPVAVPPR